MTNTRKVTSCRYATSITSADTHHCFPMHAHICWHLHHLMLLLYLSWFYNYNNCMALNSLLRADIPLRNCSLTFCIWIFNLLRIVMDALRHILIQTLLAAKGMDPRITLMYLSCVLWPMTGECRHVFYPDIMMWVWCIFGFQKQKVDVSYTIPM